MRIEKTVSILLPLMMLMNLTLVAQVPAAYNWVEDRKMSSGQDLASDDPLSCSKYHIQYDYYYDESLSELNCHYTKHQIIKVGNDGAVEQSNRIYIPMNGVKELVEVKARTITAAGDVVLFDKNNLKELKDDESDNSYKLFALEGVEVGSEVEYFYTVDQEASYFGREYFQFQAPFTDMSFELSCPSNLQYDYKSYNGLVDVKEIEHDTLSERRTYGFKNASAEMLRQEEFSVYENNRQRLEFKLAYNSSGGEERLFTWDDAAERIYQIFFPLELEEKEAAASVIEQIDLLSTDDERTKIAKIEHYIKSTFYLNEQGSDITEYIPTILENKYSTERGIARLMASVLIIADVDIELVVTSERTGIAFDKDFDTWNYLGDYLLYMPSIKEFIAPYSFELRLGTIPSQLEAIDGLFISNLDITDYVVPTGDIRFIEPAHYTKNVDNLRIDIKFDEDMMAKVALSREFSGYFGSLMKTAYPRMESKQKEDLLKSIMEDMAPDASFTSIGLMDEDFELSKWQDPFGVECEFTTAGFTEEAGEFLLFQIGETIGRQIEMYQEFERQTDVENDNNRGYDRKITMEIPEGYSIDNLDDIKMNVSVEKDGEVVYLFDSDYTLKGSLLEVQIDEFYNEIYWPKERFEEYRKVINAAADWNKVTLVMQPD